MEPNGSQERLVEACRQAFREETLAVVRHDVFDSSLIPKIRPESFCDASRSLLQAPTLQAKDMRFDAPCTRC